MRKMFVLLITAALLFTTSSAIALTYTFDTDVEGFQNVAWQPDGTVKQTHTAGGWQMMMTKEFSWEAGGGSANQQLEMQAMANNPLAHISFDVRIDGTSFLPGVSDWYQFNLVGNSDGSAGWTQIDKVIEGWHNADDPTVITVHVDKPFSALGWQPGDTWFQLWTGTNSGSTFNVYLDNVVLTPEPATLSMLGLGALALLRKKR